jgi:hypothetical protein
MLHGIHVEPDVLAAHPDAVVAAYDAELVDTRLAEPGTEHDRPVPFHETYLGRPARVQTDAAKARLLVRRGCHGGPCAPVSAGNRRR